MHFGPPRLVMLAAGAREQLPEDADWHTAPEAL